MKPRTLLKQHSDDVLIAIILILTILICSTPFRQEIEVTSVKEYASTDDYHIEVAFGGPEITWVRVICNRSAEIRFLHQTGVWTSTENALLASFKSTSAIYNFESKHSMNIVEVYSDGPITVKISYTYKMEMETTIINRIFTPITLHP